MAFRALKAAGVAALLLVMTGGLAAADPLPKTEFDWTTAWANLSPQQNSVLNDVTRVLKECADSSVKPSDIKMYAVDFNRDGLTDIIVDNSALNGHSLPSCNAQPCVNGDCYLGVYLKKAAAPVQILVPAKQDDPQCPATASANTDCLAHCPALQGQCPLLFQDQYQSIYNIRAGLWNLFDPDNMPMSIANVQPDAHKGLVLFNHPNDQSTTLCGSDELAAYQSGGGYNRCLKFYQWDAKTQYMVDLWSPVAQLPQGLPDKDGYNETLFNPDTLVLDSRGPVKDTVNGAGFKLAAGAQIVLNTQIGIPGTCSGGCSDRGPVGVGSSGKSEPATCGKTCYQNLQRRCIVVSNTSHVDYLLPNNTTDEMNAFYYHLPAGVTVSDCHNHYTPWKGEDALAAWLNKQTCGTTLSGELCALSDRPLYCDIAYLWGVTRECVSALGCTLDPSVCANDESLPANDRALGVVQKLTCYGAATCIRSVSCVADTTMITTTEKRHKLARELRIGETITSFAAGQPDKLITARITDIKITPNTNVYEIGGLTLTGNHYVVTANRGKVAAEHLAINDVLVKADGSHEAINSISRLKEPVTVYNIYTDKGDGFIANDILVLSQTAGAEVKSK